MSTYQDCQNLINNLSNLKMDARDDTAANAVESLSPSNASPPDFDFNLPCRFFKSSFARSLSLTNASAGNQGNQCKSLDYDMRSINNTNSSSSSNNHKLSCLPRRETATTTTTAVAAVPPLPQRRLSQAGSFYQQNNEATITNTGSSSQPKQVFATDDDDEDQEKPPALPARRPLSLHNLTLSQNLSVNNECQMNTEQQQQQQLTQLRQQAFKKATINNSNTNSLIMPINGNNNNNNNHNNKNFNNRASVGIQSSQKVAQCHHQHFTNPNGSVQNLNNNSSSVNNKNNNNNNINFRRNNNNNIVWSSSSSSHQQKNVEQDCNVCTFDQLDEDGDDVEDFNSNYHDTSKSSQVSDYNNHFHNSHQMLHTMIPTINIHNNQQQQQQQHQQQQLQHQHQQQQQQQHQMSSYEMLNDNTTNVEAVILQNQVDTLQWQLKQVETSCDMYRAVMEEVVRFLERYQSQKQLQQQQQQQQQQQLQQQQQMAIQKHNSNNNNKMEHIPRSKSLFQVYIAGGHEKSSNGNCNLDETSTSLSSTSSSSTSYLRARSSTNLIDLKHQPTNASSCIKSKDDHHFETGLTPSQSYSAFKDFTWRRSPKKADSRLNTAKDDVEEKLNQEAFRLLRTIQNLLNTSQHQPDLAHHRHSLAPAAALPMGRLSKAMSTTSVMTLPGPPLLNSTSLTIGANSAGSSTPDSATSSPTTSTANNAASNNLAPEMLFLRSANMRDSRLSLRSSTDSSVHSTSSAASSASSKVETDEEPTTPFHSPPNILTHKQNHHLAGSSTEDESGFSSISSFPDIGVPLSSTLLPSTPSSSKSRALAKELKSLKANERDLQTADSRNSTLKANVVGLPLNSSQDMSHRWDSPSKTYHNASNKFQRFSALANEDSNTVLWV